MTDSDVEVLESDELVGEWLSPREAQARLQISERTLWRRVSQGKLRRRQVDGQVRVLVMTGDGRRRSVGSGDGRWQADDSQRWASENGQVADTGQDDSQRDGQAEVERALALVDRFDEVVGRQIQPLLEELGRTRQQLVELASTNGRLGERVEHLEGELTILRTHTAPHEGRQPASDEPIAQPRGLWGRLTRVLARGEPNSAAGPAPI